MKRRPVLSLLLVLSFCLPLAFSQQAGDLRWVTTWATAQLLVRPAAPAAPQSARKSPGASGFRNQTLRMVLRTSVGGERIRIRLANAFGGSPVILGGARVALRAQGSQIVPGSDRPLTFNGNPGCTLGPGVVLLSDPVALKVPPLTHLTVSLFFPEETGPPTVHATGLHTTYISKEGDFTAADPFPEESTTLSYYWLAGVEVAASPDTSLVVALGDSITDGAVSTPNTDRTWPALLAARLASTKQTSRIAVANLGIGGNRVLRDGTGASALARLDRDVLSQPGVRWLMFLEGINDIGAGARSPAQAVTAEELIAGHKQIIERARAMGIKVIGCTLTPYEGAGYYSEQGEAVRQALNQWIRTSGAYDAVVDFDAATRDPQNPRRFRADYDPGDHLHPNDKGYQAMADAVDLKIFTAAPPAPPRKR